LLKATLKQYFSYIVVV